MRGDRRVERLRANSLERLESAALICPDQARVAMMHVSPNIRNEAIAYLILIFRISRQVPGEDFLLVRYAEIQNGQEERYEKERPP